MGDALFIRRAGALDARALADLLNEIIARGGTTAMTQPVTGADIAQWMQTPGAIWHVAENDRGQLQGFQWVEPKATLPADTLDIATFARLGATGIGIGSALFEHTKAAARAQGARFINATIRADNEGGLAYYQSRAFERYAFQENVDLGGGLLVDRIQMLFKLG